MRITEADKAKNRALIVSTASRLFREKGVHSVGIADLMSEAGFTHGGFYNHFASKEALAGEVCETSIARGNAWFAVALARPDADDAWRLHVERYLSAEHRDTPETGCTVGALMGDLAHEGQEVQACVVGGSQQFLSILAAYFGKRYRLDAADARRRAIVTWTQMLGALSLSRAVVRADPAFADEVLRTCRDKLLSGSRR